MVNGQTVNCETVWKEISNYIDGEVEAGLRAAMDEHFRVCTKCASVLAGTRNVVRLYGDERMLEAPAGFGQRLENRLARRAAPGKRWSTWAAWLVPVAALLLIGVVLQWGKLEEGAHRLLSPHAQPGWNIPGDLQVVVADDSKVFHVASCDLVEGKTNLRTMTAKEALAAGYVPCVRCLRKYLQSASMRRLERETEADADSDGAKEAEENKASVQ
jgi:hypothetical protein